MDQENPQKIYSQMDSVWPENNRWYNYTHSCILNFIDTHLYSKLSDNSVYLNAGSGGSEYKLKGTCHHVDIAENLIRNFNLYTVASIEDLPFKNNIFDAVICVGSVLNYCDAILGIKEITRVLKPGGYLILEFERSNTGELLFTSDYGKASTKQQYDYMGHTHTLWLYSEKVIAQLLKEYDVKIDVYERYHCLSSVVNRFTHLEEYSGRYAKYDKILKPFSYFLAHNAIFLCRKL